MSYKEVKLTSYEMMMAAHAGALRQIENLNKNRQAAYGAGTKNDWQLHIEGCMGEFALAKHLGIFFNGKGKFRGTDVGDVDVRTRSSHSYDLILHPRDPDDLKFYLVTGNNGIYRVHGWIYGRDGKDKKYWADPAGGRPAFFIPKSELNQP